MSVSCVHWAPWENLQKEAGVTKRHWQSAPAALTLALIKGEKNSIAMWSSFWSLQLDFIFGNRIMVCVRASYPILCLPLAPKKRLPKTTRNVPCWDCIFFFLRLQRVKTEIQVDENIFLVVHKWFGILGMCQWQELNSLGRALLWSECRAGLCCAGRPGCGAEGTWWGHTVL